MKFKDFIEAYKSNKLPLLYEGMKILRLTDNIGGFILIDGGYCNPKVVREEDIIEFIDIDYYVKYDLTSRYIGELIVYEDDSESGDYRLVIKQDGDDIYYGDTIKERICRALRELKYHYYVYDYTKRFFRLSGSYNYQIIKLVSIKTIAEMILGHRPYNFNIDY